jgi:hypothetical protein
MPGVASIKRGIDAVERAEATKEIVLHLFEYPFWIIARSP